MVFMEIINLLTGKSQRLLQLALKDFFMSRLMFFLGVLCSMTAFGQQNEAAFYLVKDSRPQAVIVIAENALDPVRDASADLQTYLYKISGAKVKIISDNQNVSGSRILIGESKYTRQHGYRNSDFKEQEYLIKTIGKDLILMGRDENNVAVKRIRGSSFCSKKYFQQIGSLYAVNSFLEKFCKVRWYMPTELGEVVPRKKNIAVPAVDLRRTPSTDYRAMFAYDRIPKKLWLWKYTKVFKTEPPYLSNQETLAWGRRLKMGGEPFATNHGQGDYVKRFGKSHPEWFADSTAQFGNQLCYSNPEVLKQVVADARNFYDGKYSGTWHIGKYFSVMPSDTRTWCKCKKCAPQYDKTRKNGFYNGYVSKYVWTFVCKVAREIAKTHPKGIIGCAAYSDYTESPKGIVLPDNVSVTICKERYANYDPKNKEKTHKFIKDWAKVTKKIFFWDYYLFPESRTYERFPMVAPHSIATDIALMKRLGLKKGMMCQMDEAFLRNLVLDHLRIYVTMKLLDDWDSDVDDILEEYYRLFYGPAAGPMKEFWTSLEQMYFRRRDPKSKYTGADYDWMVLCPPEDIKRLGKMVAAALRMAPVGSLYRKRVELINDAVYQPGIVNNSKRARERMKNIKNLNCPRVSRAPVMDGTLNDPLWQEAAKAINWRSIDGGALTVPTESRIMYDDKNLYIGFVCRDQKGYKPKQICKSHDGQAYRDDSVEIFIDVNRKMRGNYFHIVTNTVPIIYDSSKDNKTDWESETIVVADVKDGIWTVEMAVPLKSLGVKKIKSGDIWGINFCRNRRGLPGFVSPFMNWSGPNGYHKPGRFGILTFK